MPNKYYIDTCIWIDYYEDRFGFNNEHLGRYASKLLFQVLLKVDFIIVSTVLVRELKIRYSMDIINHFLKLFEKKIILVSYNKNQLNEAKFIALRFDLPLSDVLHAILARDNNAILITRDKHFQLLRNLVEIKKPEEIIEIL